MPEETKVITEEPKAEPKEDLISRVSKVDTEQKKEEGKFNINDLDAEIEKVTDPNVKNHLLGLKKSLISGENQKYQEIARLRKEYESKLSEQTSWTPDRVQKLLNDPTFVNAAQDILGTQTTQEEASMLSETEKKNLQRIQYEQKMFKRQIEEVNRLRQDEALKSKYANYNPEAVDTITADLLAGKIQATREDLWKVKDYEAAVERAYKLGLEDRKRETGEKIQSMSTAEGVSVTGTQAPLKQEQGESDMAYFRRLGDYNLKKALSRQKKE